MWYSEKFRRKSNPLLGSFSMPKGNDRLVLLGNRAFMNALKKTGVCGSGGVCVDVTTAALK